MRIREQVRVDGVPLNMVAPWGDLTYSYAWPGGCDEVSFGLYLPALSRRSRLRKGVKVEVFDGSTRIWVGTLGQPNWRDGEFTADGLSKRAGSFTALDGAGNATSRADTAVDTAIAAGAEWAGRSGVPPTPATATATTDGPNSVQTVLDAVSDEAGQRWGVFADGLVTMAADASTPMWRLAPGMVDLGQDDTDYASRLRVRYIDSATGTYKTLTPAPEDTAASALYGVTEATVDLTVYKPMTSAKATAI
ncbi:MAG: hypothetical protein HOV66_22750, partial [Streptomycetaceae bacterium]|nr:hypothetical protein [Streptomycetaceae bacterium]